MNFAIKKSISHWIGIKNQAIEPHKLSTWGETKPDCLSVIFFKPLNFTSHYPFGIIIKPLLVGLKTRAKIMSRIHALAVNLLTLFFIELTWCYNLYF